jgi:hypothetical protein
MQTSQMSLSHARNLVAQITHDDDGEHAAELLELIHGIADPESVVGLEVQKDLYRMTPDFDAHFNEFVTVERRLSAVSS